MTRLFTVARLSPNIEETPQGYLLCRDVAITRAGELVYLASEVPEVRPGPDGRVKVMRSLDDILDADTMASFEGQPVTMGHPHGFVGPQNWKDLTNGITQNLRPGTGAQSQHLVADLLITDFEAVEYIKRCRDKGQLPEVSCGYEAEFEEVSPGIARQLKIRGNHVALVTIGRAGSGCAIRDQEPEARRIYDEAIQETPDVTDTKPSLRERFLAVLTGKELTTDSVTAAFVLATADAEGDLPVAQAVAADPVAQKLDAVLAALAKLIEMQAPAATAVVDVDPAIVPAPDAELMSRAEILAPGIKAGKGVRDRAMAQFAATPEGKEILTGLMGGKAMDSASSEVLDVIFIAAAEQMAERRRRSLEDGTRRATAASQTKDAAPVTAERLVEIHREHRAKQRA